MDGNARSAREQAQQQLVASCSQSEQHLAATDDAEAAGRRRSPRKAQKPHFSTSGAMHFDPLSAREVQSAFKEIGVLAGADRACGFRTSTASEVSSAKRDRTAAERYGISAAAMRSTSEISARYSAAQQSLTNGRVHTPAEQEQQLKKVKISGSNAIASEKYAAEQRSQSILSAIRSSDGVVPEHLLYLLETDTREELGARQMDAHMKAEPGVRAKAHFHAQEAHFHAHVQAQMQAHAHAQAQALVQAHARVHAEARTAAAHEAHLPKVKTAEGAWEEWVLNLGAKARNALIKERRFTDSIIGDLKQTVRKRQWVHAARRYKARKRSK